MSTEDVKTERVRQIECIVREDTREAKALGCIFADPHGDRWNWESWRPTDGGRTEGMYTTPGEALDAMLAWMREE